MDPAALTLPPALALVGNVLALGLVALAVRRARWRRFLATEPTHVWLGSLVALAVLWSIRTTLPGAPPLHLLGMGALCLSAGPALALVGGAIVVVVTRLVLDAPLANAGAAFLVDVAVPVAVQWGALRLAERVLPRNPFAYFFAVAFAGAAASFFAAAMAARALVVIAAADVAGGAVTHGEYAVLALLLSFGEATLTGMLITLAVVYRPAWVVTFDDALYLGRR